MKLLHLLPSSFFGGPEAQVLLSSRTLRRAHGVESRFLLMPRRGQTLAEHPLAAILARSGFAGELLETPGRYDLGGGVRLLAASIAADPPDRLISYGYKANLMASRLGAAWPGRRIAVLHGWTAADWKVRLFEWLERRALRVSRPPRAFDAIVTVAESQQALLRRLGVVDGRVHWIPNALDPSELPPPLARAEILARAGLDPGRGPRVLVGTVGRLSREKAQRDLITAFEIFARRAGRGRADAGRHHLVVVGDGPERAALEARRAASSSAGQVHIVGFQADGSRWLGGFDLFVLPSRTEASPVVILEAAAQGVPVLGTRVGDVARMIHEDGNPTGWLAEPGRPESLAEKLSQALGPGREAEAKAERERRARAASTLLDSTHSPRHQGERWWALLTSL